MTKYDAFNESMRQKTNQFFYEGFKRQISDCPNYEFNRCVLSFVKTFIQHGRIRPTIRDTIYTLHINIINNNGDETYYGYITIKEEESKKRITISTSPNKKDLSQEIRKEVTFSGDIITMIDTSYRKSSQSTLESTTISLFENDCSFHTLGENNLVYRTTLEKQTENGHSANKLEALKIKKDGTALTSIWDPRIHTFLHSKTNGIFYTFEEALKGTPLSLEKEEILPEDVDTFVNGWLKELSLSDVEKIMIYTPTID